MTTEFEQERSEFERAFDTMSLLNGELARNVHLNERDRQMLVGSLCLESAVLLEGDPGTGKTTIANTAAIAMGGDFNRVQGTSDQVPSDITGSEIWNPGTRDFEFRPGPIFTNVLLIDEINRTSEKTQAGLLQGMAERNVTVNGKTHKMPQPFVVLATQNPNEDGEGTSNLTKANLDRFPISIKLPNLSAHEMARIATMSIHPKKVLDNIQDIMATRTVIETMSIPIDVVVRAGRIVEALREIKDVDLSVSVLSGARPVQRMMRQAQALALSEKERVFTNSHIERVAPYVLSHRTALTFDAENMQVDLQEVIDDAIKTSR